MSYVAEILADSPAGYWRLGEASGLPQDSSGNGRHCTGIYGTPTYGVPGAIADGDTGCSFNGTDARFGVTDVAGLDLGDIFTLEAWVIRGALGADRGIVSKGTGAYYLRLNATGHLEMLKSNQVSIITSTVAVPAGGWHHVVGTRNADGALQTKLYIDGVEVSGPITFANCINTVHLLTIGAQAQSVDEHFNGSIDEVAVYPTALSAARVAAHYAAAAAVIVTGGQPPAVAAIANRVPAIAGASHV